MESILGRYRNLIILVGVLFLQALGLAVQVKRSGEVQNTRLIRIWAVDAVTPFERAVVRAQNAVGDIWHNYFFLRGVRAENRDLKRQIEQMRLEQVRLNEDAAQAHRLQSLLAFKEQYIAKTVPAQVIGSCASDLSRCVYIDKGDNDGVKTDMAVITAGGIVGKVLHTYPSTSQVLMINDQSSGVGVLLEKSRLQGVLKGTPNGELVVERVMSDETVSPGETVLSSGGDQIFPKGLPVGTVSSIKPGREMFLNIKIRPSADLNRVEEVLVITQKQEREPAVEESGNRVRAADILAQRLPSVPDKPETPAVTPAQAGTVSSGATKPPASVVTPQNNAVVSKPVKTPSTGAAGAAASGTTVSHTVPAGPGASGALSAPVSATRSATVSPATKPLIQPAPASTNPVSGPN